MRADRFATEMAGARRRDGLPIFVGRAELYCAGECPIREVAVTIKEYDDRLTGPLRCPACHSVLKVHFVATIDEISAADERAARLSIRTQLYRARHGAEVAVPITLDDALPRPEELAH